jgi:hypothetical protein
VEEDVVLVVELETAAVPVRRTGQSDLAITLLELRLTRVVTLSGEPHRGGSIFAAGF